MLTPDESATICAALRFWQDEMAITNAETTRHYFDVAPHPRLTAIQIQTLIEKVASLRTDQ